ncbi:MAG: HAD-IA family hydrolase [Theionarchaea archaeon]|nr:HAD-IA family hydrolase [Theionarchaea archaeon]
MIRAVTFDLWGTLIQNSEEYDRRLREKRVDLLYAALEEEISRTDLMNALQESWQEIQCIRSTLKDVPTSQQVSILQQFLNVNSTDLEKPYTEAVLHFLPSLNPYTMEILRNLNTRIGLISNTGRTPGKVLRFVLETLGILAFFDTTIFSNEVGWLKPHPEIFCKASQDLGVPLNEILHVGDDKVTDEEGARAAGMHTLLIETPSDLRRVRELVSW